MRVSLVRTGDRLQVEVRDYGAGLPADFRLDRRNGSLGMQVVTALSGQLCGDLTAETVHPGARFALSLPLQPCGTAPP